MSDTTHECPASGCTVRCPHHILFCRPHWFMVPKPLRDTIWRTWKNGSADEYLQAREEAIRLVNERLVGVAL